MESILHMNGEEDTRTSYSNNSLLQMKVICMTKATVKEAIIKLYCSHFPTTLAFADLGCASGPNTLFVVSEFIKVMDEIRQKLGRKSPEYIVFLNDLPENDFNSIFRSLPSFQAKLKEQLGTESGPCFITGVPGSFYGRLFSSNTLHFVHSSYSLMWLSKVPEGLENNRRNIYVAKNSPPSVIKAYYELFQQDFSMFLMCRSKELVTGGRMVLTILGRRSDDPTSKECCYIWDLLAMALNDMVSEGLIEEGKLNSFNIPQYLPSPIEIKMEVEKEGSFSVDRLDVTEVNLKVSNNAKDEAGLGLGLGFAKCMRAVAEPLLVNHFGEGIIDDVIKRYTEIVSSSMSTEKTELVNVTISLVKH